MQSKQLMKSIIPQILKLRDDEHLTYSEIAELMQKEGYAGKTGKPVNANDISMFMVANGHRMNKPHKKNKRKPEPAKQNGVDADEVIEIVTAPISKELMTKLLTTYMKGVKYDE